MSLQSVWTQTCLLRSCMTVEQDEPVRRLTDGHYCVKAAHGGSETSGSAFCLLSLSFHSGKTNPVQHACASPIGLNVLNFRHFQIAYPSFNIILL